MACQLLIDNGSSNLLVPTVKSGVKWETQRKGAPGKLTFTVTKDANLKISSGNAVSFKVDGTGIFYGFIFGIDPKHEDGTVSITAYDQMRYLKNKDTYVYENKKANEVIKMILDDYRLRSGTLTDTKFKIPSRVDDAQTLFDIIQNAMDVTIQNTGRLYVMWDNFGKVELWDIESRKINTLINDKTAQSYDYKISIDGETYNYVKLYYANKDTGKRDTYVAKDSKNINKWGYLCYYESIDEKVNGKNKVDALLKLHNQEERSLSVSKAYGDIRARAGCSVPVFLELDDMTLKNYMLIEKAVHTFEDGQHTMDLNLRGGLITNAQ